MKHMISVLIVILLLTNSILIAFADDYVNRVDVQYYVCPAEAYETDVSGNLEAFLNHVDGPLHRPLVLVLPDGHPEMYITLVTSIGYGFSLDATAATGGGTTVEALVSLLQLILSYAAENNDPSIKSAKFYVSFYDENENLLWFENDAIPQDTRTAGHREFRCGTDVKYITVYSWYDMAAGEVFKASSYPSKVSYENARPVE